MKEKLYITFVALAVVVMMTAVFLPHHHHNGLLCTAVEYCEDDGKYNDEHTGHASDHTRCIEDSHFMVSKWGGINDNDASASMLPLFVIIENIISFCDACHENTHSKTLYRQSLYKSADVCKINSLRGPPCLFV